MVGLTSGEVVRLTGVVQQTLNNWETSLGLRPSVKKSTRRGRGGSRWSMRDAINVSILKTLSDWGMPHDHLREVYRLLKTATQQQLKNSWIVSVEDKEAVARDVTVLGCKALGIEYDLETGVYDAGRARDLGYEPETAEGLSALGARINAEGSKLFGYDPRKHFTLRLVSDKEELAALTAQEGLDCRVHSLHRHVTGTIEKAKALGFGQRRKAN